MSCLNISSAFQEEMNRDLIFFTSGKYQPVAFPSGNALWEVKTNKTFFVDIVSPLTEVDPLK